MVWCLSRKSIAGDNSGAPKTVKLDMSAAAQTRATWPKAFTQPDEHRNDSFELTEGNALTGRTKSMPVTRQEMPKIGIIHAPTLPVDTLAEERIESSNNLFDLSQTNPSLFGVFGNHKGNGSKQNTIIHDLQEYLEERHSAVDKANDKYSWRQSKTEKKSIKAYELAFSTAESFFAGENPKQALGDQAFVAEATKQAVDKINRSLHKSPSLEALVMRHS